MSVWRLIEANMDRFPAPEDPGTADPFASFMYQKFPDGHVPWPWVQKILTKHGVPMPLSVGMPATEEAAEYDIHQGQPAELNRLLHFLGY